MGSRTDEHDRLLNSLVMDCMTYNFTTPMSLEYIHKRSGIKIKESAFYDRKKKLLSEDTGTEWISYQARIGFVLNHKRNVEDVQRLRDHAFEKYFFEINQPDEKYDKEYILKLHADLRDTIKLLSELNLGDQVIATMKAENDNYKKKYENLLKRINIPQTVTN